MKWANHELVSCSIALFLSHDFLGAAFTGIGSIFPDWIEGRKNIFNYRLWHKIHRGISHWMIMYFTIFFAVGFFYQFHQSYFCRYFLFFCFGALLHTMEDSICGKVPIFMPHKRFGVKIFSVGSMSEYAFSTLTCTILFFFWYK